MSRTPSQDVTHLLHLVAEGSEDAWPDLMEVVYPELRRLADRAMAGEASQKTLQPTALVHEAYLRLARSAEQDWDQRSHFFGAAARAMRRVLVEHARRRLAAKRGSGKRVTFQELAVQTEDPSLDLIALNDTIETLAKKDPRLAKLVELRYFAGLTIHETADLLQVSAATVKRDWVFARAWLYERMAV